MINADKLNAESGIQGTDFIPQSEFRNPHSNDTALLDELVQRVAQRTGLLVADSARERFVALVRERAAARGCKTLTEYRDLLRGIQAHGEWEAYARLLSTGETFFFRDHGQFDLLRLCVLPELIARHRSDKTLRLWSAACASGEEAYSLAMLLDMMLPDQQGWDILVLGSDIDSAAIEKARLGRYGSWSFRMIPDELKQRYFNPHPAIRNPQSFVLDERIARRVTFRVANLLSEPDARDMDLILCRNVFIYFDPAAVSVVADRLAGALRAGGYLMTAHTELMGHAPRGLESRLFAEGVVYQRSMEQAGATAVPAQRQIRQAPAAATKQEGDAALLNEARSQAERGEFDLAEQSCRQVLVAHPLAAEAYFLLAQLANVRGDDRQEKEYLNKSLYLDSHFVAPHMQLAALYERAGEMQRAQKLRHAAYGIVSAMPAEAVIAQYQTTAGELTQWLARWEQETGKS